MNRQPLATIDLVLLHCPWPGQIVVYLYIMHIWIFTDLTDELLSDCRSCLKKTTDSKRGRMATKGHEVGFRAGTPGRLRNFIANPASRAPGNPTASESEPRREPLYRQGLLGAALEAEVAYVK